MAYALVTFAQAKAQLASLLDDPDNVYWADAELGLYIHEALRTWGAFSHYWKERGVFSSAASTAFYSLQTQLPSLLGYTVTDRDLISVIQYQLLEPSTGSSWTGTDQFTLADLTQAIQRRRDAFLVATGIVLARSTPAVIANASGRSALDQTIIDVRRCAYQVAGEDAWNTLWRSDEYAFGAATAMTWTQTPGTPETFSVSSVPPVTIQLMPPPLASGTLDLITTNSGSALDPASTPTILGVPDDFAWVIKWGALADLLGRDGQARDPERAEYCQARWEEGIMLARMYSSIVQLQVNDTPVYTISLQALDTSDPAWQSTEGQPVLGALAGHNLLALSPVPDAIYGISADVIRRAPVPAGDGDYLQIGAEEFDIVLRYAEHIAAFKMAGDEFKATLPQYKGIGDEALLFNSRLRAAARDYAQLQDRALLEDSRRPRTYETGQVGR